MASTENENIIKTTKIWSEDNMLYGIISIGVWGTYANDAHIFLCPAMPNNWFICIMLFTASVNNSQAPQKIFGKYTATAIKSTLMQMNEIYRNHCSSCRLESLTKHRSNKLYIDIKQIQVD